MQRQYATFTIDGSLFGIDVLSIREINRHAEVTEVSPAPEFVRGLMNLRGQIVTVIDPGVKLGTGRRPMTADTCCIVLKTRQENERGRQEQAGDGTALKDAVAMLVDRIGDMVAADDRAIEQAPANVNGIDSEFIDGVVKLEQGLLVLLSLPKLLAENN